MVAERGFTGWPVAVLTALCVPVILYRLGSYGIVSGDEAFYHGVAESMVETGNWLSIDFRGQHRPYDTFMNAPVQYWLRALLIAWFGSNYWTMRIPSALFGVAAVLMTYRMVLPLAGRRAAFLSGLVLLTNLQFVYLHSARVGVLETTLAFLFALTAYLFVRGVQGRGSFAGHHLCLALILNCKLPVAIIPVLAEVAYFTVHRDARRHLGRWLLGGLVAAPLALSWHLYQAFVVGEPLAAVLGRMGGQGAGAGGAVAERLGNLRFYADVLVFGAFPHVIVYPVAIASLLASEHGRDEREAWHVYLLYPLALLAFFTLVSKHTPWYVIPAYPFLSAAAGTWLSRLLDRRMSGGNIAFAAVAGALLLWVNAGPVEFNPFDPLIGTANAFARWRSVGDLPGGLGFAITAGALGLLLFGLHRKLGDRLSRPLAGALSLAIVGYACIRVSLPLAHTDYVSHAEEVRRRLDDAAAAGIPVAFPVEIPQGSHRSAKARFYFARDFEIVPLPRGLRPFAAGYQLYPKGDPRARTPGEAETPGPRGDDAEPAEQ